MESLKLTKREFDEVTKDPSGEHSTVPDPSSVISGLDSYEFTWNKQHPLRRYYTSLKKSVYAKYDALSSDNIDIKILIDEVLVLKTQLFGVGRLVKDVQIPKNLSYRVSMHQKKLLELMTVIMKYTRKEPEKEINKKITNKGKSIAGDLKKKLSESDRQNLAESIKKSLRSRMTTEEDEDAPFGESGENED